MNLENSLINRAFLNLYSLNLIQPLLGNRFLPFTTSSLAPANLAYILNDVILNKRTNILEFGSGISTILIARAIKMHDLKSRIVSVEHDKHWHDSLISIVKSENLDDIITFIYAPLANYSIAVEENLWYDTAILDAKLTNSVHFDLVLVDGPPAMNQKIAKSRYPAFAYIHTMLADEFSLYLDDVDRPGEIWIAGQWARTFNISFTIKNGTLGYFLKGPSFNLEIY